MAHPQQIPTRTETLIWAFLQMLGVVCVGYGLWYQYVLKMSLTGILYCTLWYILGGVSHLLGLLSIFIEALEEDELKSISKYLLQKHFVTAWLAVVLGYPLMVTYSWMMHFPTIFVQAHLILVIIPLIAWLSQNGRSIMRSTQFCTGIACLSHFVLCLVVKDVDVWGLVSSVVMAVNILALSMPTRYRVWEFNSRELFVIGIICTSYLMNLSIAATGNTQRVAKTPKRSRP